MAAAGERVTHRRKARKYIWYNFKLFGVYCWNGKLILVLILLKIDLFSFLVKNVSFNFGGVSRR